MGGVVVRYEKKIEGRGDVEWFLHLSSLPQSTVGGFILFPFLHHPQIFLPPLLLYIFNITLSFRSSSTSSSFIIFPSMRFHHHLISLLVGLVKSGFHYMFNDSVLSFIEFSIHARITYYRSLILIIKSLILISAHVFLFWTPF